MGEGMTLHIRPSDPFVRIRLQLRALVVSKLYARLRVEQAVLARQVRRMAATMDWLEAESIYIHESLRHLERYEGQTR